ncbi:Caprin homolog [Anthophora retusa]
MPSANPKLEKQASTETVDPIRQAIIVIEHKIRNLEKRKVKLESYKDLQKNGRELNADQKTAVAKYDEVLQTLDITKELYKQIGSIASDAVKHQKKLARKEAIERMQQDIAKVKEVLLIQDALMNMGTEAVREDFLAGRNGAVQLSEQDLKYLDSLYNEVMMKHHREEGEPTFLQQVQKVAEHYVAIVDGKQREVVGTTYNKLKEIIASINQCGYFDQVHETEAVVEEVVETVVEAQVTETPAQEQVTEEYNSNDRHIPPESMIPIPNFPVQVAPLPVVPATTPVSGPIPVVAQPIPPHPAAPVETSYYTNATGFVPQPQPQQQQPQQTPQQPPQAPRINDVIGTPNFFFLQESELDSPDVASQAPIVSHIPAAVNAPIPSQTFTNQNFANAPVVAQQVMYQHQPPQDMSHIPGFANPNPPPPIPMPPSHQQPNMQYSPQHPTNFQQQPQQQQQQQPQAPPQQMSQQAQTQNFEHPQENQQQPAEEKTEETQEETAAPETELEQPSESVDWCQMTETNDWNQIEQSQQPAQDSQQTQQQTSQQAWGDQQRSAYRGRGGRRGNSNGYNGRGRGGGYQQNGRGGQGTYYRNDSNYQNGYQQRSWGNSEGNSGYNSGYKRGGGGPRGGPRGERGMDRGSRGQFRSQRGGNRTGYTPRGKPHTQQ